MVAKYQGFLRIGTRTGRLESLELRMVSCGRRDGQQVEPRSGELTIRAEYP